MNRTKSATSYKLRVTSSPSGWPLVARSSLLVAFLLLIPLQLQAQDNAHIHIFSYGTYWQFPYSLDEVSRFSFTDDQSYLQAHAGDEVVIPFKAAELDTITFRHTPTALTKNKYQVFQMYITTNDGTDITSKEEYTPCYISINGCDAFPHYSGHAKIRGRGNSTWLWYDKKPYRVKLAETSPILGLGQNKDWVLLANYRDVTDLMNTFVFEAGEWLGLPYTNHTRYVELFLNGNYSGLYQLTEQVEQGGNRVAVDEERGLLLALDLDDGPGLSPYTTDNFYSEVFGLPVCIKNPGDDVLTEALIDSIKQEFALLESAIDAKSFSQLNRLMDIRSFVRYLILQELVLNVELIAPRSVYIHKDVEGKWTMGPLWDFDAGYDFNWATMTTGHNYFSSHTELVLGTDPYHHRGCYDGGISPFFTRMFGNHGFVTLFKEEWAVVKSGLMSSIWPEMESYISALNRGAMSRESTRWPIRGKYFQDEVHSMHSWLLRRVEYLDEVINAYPLP